MSEQEFGRRALLELLGGLALLAACSDNETSTNSTNSTHPNITGQPGSGSSKTAIRTGTTIDASGPKLPANVRSTTEQLRRERDKINGTWLGTWRDDRDRGGNVDGVFDIDVAKRAINFTLKIDGPFLGATVPTVMTYRLDGDALSANDDDVVLQSPLVGPFDLKFLGFGQFQISASEIPGHKDITSLVIKGAFEGLEHGTMTYTVDGQGSAVGKGAVAWSRNGIRAIAVKPGVGDDITAFVGGDYAASLITQVEAATLLGVPMKAPEANGGKIQMRAGIDVSNGRVETIAGITDPGYRAIQYSIFRCRTKAIAVAYLNGYFHYSAMPNIGDRAIAAPTDPKYPISSVVVLKGRDILDINIVRGAVGPGTNATTISKQRSDKELIAVARTILSRLP